MPARDEETSMTKIDPKIDAMGPPQGLAVEHASANQVEMLGRDDSSEQAEPGPGEMPIFTFLLVKLASRCNIKCTYCYWFRDADVYKKPAVLTIEAEDAFRQRLEEHIKKFELDEFVIIFHG